MTYQNGDMLVPGLLTASSGRLSKESFRAGSAGDESKPIFVCLFVFAKYTTSSVPLGPLGAEDKELPNTGQQVLCSVLCSACPQPLGKQVFGDQVLLLYLQSRVDKNSPCLLALEGKG